MGICCDSKIVADARLDALIRVLQCLQAPQVLPLRITAVRDSVRGGSTEVLEIEIDVTASDLAPETFRFLTAKISQLPFVFTTVS